MNIFQQALRAALFVILAFFGMAMAFIFMASTAIAVAVLYIAARLQGRPFGIKAYWAERRRPASHPGYRPRHGAGGSRAAHDIIDVEVREIP